MGFVNVKLVDTCLLVSCVIYAGESGGFDGAGAAGDVVNAAGEAGDVFSHTGFVSMIMFVDDECAVRFLARF